MPYSVVEDSERNLETTEISNDFSCSNTNNLYRFTLTAFCFEKF